MKKILFALLVAFAGNGLSEGLTSGEWVYIETVDQMTDKKEQKVYFYDGRSNLILLALCGKTPLLVINYPEFIGKPPNVFTSVSVRFDKKPVRQVETIRLRGEGQKEYVQKQDATAMFEAMAKSSEMILRGKTYTGASTATYTLPLKGFSGAIAQCK